jgi:hypothetical protein
MQVAETKIPDIKAATTPYKAASTTNGPRIKRLCAPINFITSISSRRLKIAMRMVLKITIADMAIKTRAATKPAV